MLVLRPKPLVFSLQLILPRTNLVRERIIAVVRARLAQIRQANGYLTEITEVHRGALIVAEPDPLPYLNFWDTDQTVVRTGSDLQENALTLVVATYDKVEDAAVDDGRNPDELCAPAVYTLADIEHAVLHDPATGKVDTTLGGLAESCAYQSGTYVTGLVGALWIQTESRFEIRYMTRIGDPFQQVAW